MMESLRAWLLSLAGVALLTALGYWNEWFLCMLYVTEKKLYPLQYLLAALP